MVVFRNEQSGGVCMACAQSPVPDLPQLAEHFPDKTPDLILFEQAIAKIECNEQFLCSLISHLGLTLLLR